MLELWIREDGNHNTSIISIETSAELHVIKHESCLAIIGRNEFV